MKKALTILITSLAVGSLAAQCSERWPTDTVVEDRYIYLEPTPPLLDTAYNVSIGPWTVCAVYPDRAEFVLSLNGRLTVMQPGPDGHDTIQVFSALVTQLSDAVFRAQLTPEQWVEVNAVTGITVVHQDCFTSVFVRL
jgi:hypothetical protein